MSSNDQRGDGTRGAESNALGARGTAVSVDEGQRAELERSLRLIPIHQGLASAYFWIPIMVLFTRARFDLDGAIFLSAFYYLSVVALEVPSGWMSDRLGRVVTLRVAAVGWVVAQLCFLVGGESLAVIAVGQFFLAVGFASLSGTDVTFHYDTLESLGRAAEYADRQARVSSIGYVVAATSALTGGALGLIDLRLAFAAALIAACAQFLLTLRLVEPPVLSSAALIDRQLRRCLAYLKDRYLGWIFGYGILMVVLEHVAFTTLQPWLTEVLDQTADALGSTPLVSGILMAGVAFVGAAAARLSAPMARRFGTVPVLLGLALLSAVIVTTMAIWFSLAVLVLVALRSVQGAAAPVLISAAVAPRVNREQRATLLSLNSLAGRLAYGLVLLAASGLAEDNVPLVLRFLSTVAWLCVGVLAVSAWWLVRSLDALPAE